MEKEQREVMTRIIDNSVKKDFVAVGDDFKQQISNKIADLINAKKAEVGANFLSPDRT